MKNYLRYGAKYGILIQLIMLPFCMLGIHFWEKDVLVQSLTGCVHVKDVCKFCCLIKD
jgi:hypothetical protein